MAVWSLTDIANVQKRLYKDGVKDNLLNETPLLALIEKDSSVGGELIAHSLRSTWGGGASHSFSVAQTVTTGPSFGQFQLTQKPDYVVKQVAGQVLRNIRNKSKLGLVEAVEEITDDAMRMASHRLSYQLYGTRANVLGTSTAVLGAVAYFDLTDPTEVVNFYIGQQIVFVDSAGADPYGALAGAGAAATITAIASSGTTYRITTNNANLAGTYGGIVAWVYNRGDAANGGASVGMAGLQDWVPESTAALGTTFYNVTRSANEILYAGHRYDAVAAGSIESALITGVAQMATFSNAKPSVILMNPLKFRDLQIQTGSKEVYKIELPGKSLKGKEITVGYDGVKLVSPIGTLNVIPDRFCRPYDSAFIIDPSSWVLYSEGPAIALDEDVGMFPLASSDGFEFRVKGYRSMACYEPSANMQIFNLP